MRGEQQKVGASYEKMEYPLIFDIKRHALEDGPGIRTTVFFKGCNLNCVWCHNPESIEPTTEIGFYPSQCIGCGECEKACRFEGVCLMSNPLLIDRKRCIKCGDCVRVCPSKALKRVGRYYSPEELFELLLRDNAFHEVSEGGITFSGGEPTLFTNYLATVLEKLKSKGIHTAIQTNGYFEWNKFESRLLGLTDLVMIDIKLADPDKHLRYTGKSNKLIFENLVKLLGQNKAVVIPRIPLVPGITATEKNLRAIDSILRKFGVCAECLLYNPMGISKWKSIGKQAFVDLPQNMMSKEEETRCKEIFSK